MLNNIEVRLPYLLDKAKQIQRGRMIERMEADNLLLQASLLETHIFNKQKKIERQFHRHLKLLEAKMQLIDSAKRLFESCIKRH